MIALIRKDAVWLLFFLIAASSLLTGLLLDLGIYRSYVSPSEPVFQTLFFAWWPIGAALGLMAALKEDLMQTQEYLLHRPVAPRRILVARLAGPLFTLALCLVLPFILQLVLLGPWSHVGPAADWGRMWGFFGMGSIMFSSFAVTFYAASMPRSWSLRLLFGAVALILTILLADRLATGDLDEGSASLTQYVVAQILIAMLFLGMSLRQQTELRDMDHPLAVSRLFELESLGLFCLLSFVLLCVSEFQAGVQHELVRIYPKAAEVPGGAMRLVSLDRERRTFVLTDHQHVMDRSASGVVETGPWRYSAPRVGRGTLDRVFYTCRFNGTWQPLGSSNQDGRSVSVWFHRPEQRLHVLVSPRWEDPQQPYRLTIGVGPSNRPFAEGTTWFSNGGEWRHRVLYFAEPGAGSLQVLDLSAEKIALEPRALPDEDVYVSHRGMMLRNPGGGPRSGIRGTAIIGKKAEYLLQGGQMRAMPEDWRLANLLKQKERRNKSVTTWVDPLSPHMEIRSPTGEVLLAHEFAPRTWSERRTASLLVALTGLRPPLTQVYSTFSSPKPEMRHLYASGHFDPLLMGGRRPWLLLLQIAFSAFLAWRAVRRLTRLGAESARRWYWGAMILLGGPVVWLIYRATETNRAWKRMPTHEPAKPPLILALPDTPALAMKPVLD